MASLRFSALFLFLSLFLSFSSLSHSLTCTSQKFTNNKLYDRCDDLPQLSSYLHWTYDSAKSSLSVAFVAAPARSGGWIAWAINPTGTGMAGAQSLVAFRQSNGSMAVKTFNISSYTSIVEGKLSFEVTDMSADFSDGLMSIFATVSLPAMTTTTLNHVWQVGPSVVSGFPARHDFQPANLNSRGTLDILRGESSTGGSVVDSRMKKRNIHGILNVVSWGIMFPIGIIIARYLRTFPSADPVWFYLHVFCQFSAYVIGVAGWGTGLKLGGESKGLEYSGHRNLGITLFSLATLQVFALFLRPKKEHKFRFYWNIYHHGLGYAILTLSIINVFKGFDILQPAQKWKSAYIVVIAALGVIALLLEAFTWVVVLMRKSSKSTKPYDNGLNNGQGRQQPLAP